MAAPTLQEARAAVASTHPGAAQEVWDEVLSRAGVSGMESEVEAVRLVVAAMSAAGDPMTVLCARALRIRLETFERLSAPRSTPTRTREQNR